MQVVTPQKQGYHMQNGSTSYETAYFNQRYSNGTMDQNSVINNNTFQQYPPSDFERNSTLNTQVVTYQYGQSRNNFYQNHNPSQNSALNHKSSSPSNYQMSMFLPSKPKVPPLSRESFATITDLEGELNDLASILRRERDQAEISRKNSTLGTLVQKSQLNINYPLNSEYNINQRQSQNHSIMEEMDSSLNACSVITKTSSLKAHYEGTEYSTIGRNIPKADSDNLNKQIAQLKNEMQQMHTFQLEAAQATQKMKENNDELCVKLLQSEKQLLECKRRSDDLYQQLQEANKQHQNGSMLEERIKTESLQNLNLSQSLLKQQSRSQAIQQVNNELRILLFNKEQEFQSALTVLDSLKKDYDSLKIQKSQFTALNQSIQDENQRHKFENENLKQDLNSLKQKLSTFEEENKMLKYEISKRQSEIERAKEESQQLAYEVNNFKQINGSNESEAQMLNSKVSQLNAEGVRQNNEISRLKNELEKLRCSNQQQMHSNLENQRLSASYYEDIKKQNDRLQSLTAEVEYLRARNSEQININNQIISENSSLKNQLSSLSFEKSFKLSSTQDLESVKQELQRSKEEEIFLEQQCLILSKNTTALSDKVVELRQKNKQLEDNLNLYKFNSNETNSQELVPKISQLLNSISLLQSNLEESKKKEETLKVKLDEANQQLKEQEKSKSQIFQQSDNCQNSNLYFNQLAENKYADIFPKQHQYQSFEVMKQDPFSSMAPSIQLEDSSINRQIDNSYDRIIPKQWDHSQEMQHFSQNKNMIDCSSQYTFK